MAREDNIRVFEDTEAWCRTNRKIAESLKASQAAQELILETDALPDLDKTGMRNRPRLWFPKNGPWRRRGGMQARR